MDTSWLILQLLLPLLLVSTSSAQQASSRTLRRRRPLDHQQHAVTQHPLGDQIALANTWHVPNRVISATYAENLDTGHFSQSNVVVNVLPAAAHQQRAARYTDADLANAEQLANTRTAEEYVTKAMEMRGTKNQLKAPQSSYIKYDVFANQEEKTMVLKSQPHHAQSQPPPPPPPTRREVNAPPSRSSHMDHDHDDEEDSNNDADTNVDDGDSHHNGGDDDDGGGGGSDGDGSRYFISEQVTLHQPHRPTAAPPAPVAPPIGKPHVTPMRHSYRKYPPAAAAAMPTSTVAPTRSYEDTYDYNPRKPDYGTPTLMKEQQHNDGGYRSTYGSHSQPYGGDHHQHHEPPPPQLPMQHPPAHQPYPHDSYHPLPQPTELPKSEMIKHIQHSVLRYMQELEAQGRFTTTPMPTTTTTTTTTTPTPPAVEIKTYYRIPQHSSGKVPHSTYGVGRVKSTYPKPNSAPTALPPDYYRTPSSSSSAAAVAQHDIDDSYFPPSYTTATSHQHAIESYPATTMASISYHQHSESSGAISTPHIDLTFRSKARPKPIDLAALDVGQSWSHDAEPPPLPPPTEKVYYRYPATHSSSSKPGKSLHFSAQTYHDINSMSYKPTTTTTYHQYGGGDGGADSEQTPVKFKDESQAVVTYQEPASADELLNDVQQHYRAPIHIINGIPVANPYRFNLEQLKQMFGDSTPPHHHHQHADDDIKEHRGISSSAAADSEPPDGDSDAPADSLGSGWQPSFNPEPSYTKPRVPKTHHRDRPTSGSSAPSLPYESYTSSARYKQQQQKLKEQQQQDHQHHDPSTYEQYAGEEWHAGNYRQPSEGHSSSHSSMSSSSSSSHRSKKPKGSSPQSSSSASSSNNSSSKKRQKKRPRPNNSSSSTSSSSSSSHKGKAKPRHHDKKSRSLTTELRPPPAGAY